MQIQQHLLSTLIFLPLLGAAALYLVPSADGGEAADRRVRLVALVFSLIAFAVSLLVWANFDLQNADYQMVERAAWIPTFGVNYVVGIDGISLYLVLLTTLLLPIVAIASHSVHRNVRGYLAQMLALECAMLGSLLALDLFLFYVFWEFMLFPMYFIIGIWGGERRTYATIKFVLYTVSGSVLMLVGIAYLAWRAGQEGGEFTFDLVKLLASTHLSLNEEMLLFLAFAVAFAIKVPIFPFHTWLPDAHVEAPTGGSVILAGVLLKMGLYGFLRFAFPLFPRAAAFCAPGLAVLAVIGIVYGALVAWAQLDIKKLVAYSSVSHLGYCVLGAAALNATGTTGSIYQMLNHGVSTGALFLLVGVVYDRRHTRLISEYGGLAARVPVYAFLFLVFTLSSIALPLTNGFVGEFLILSGSFNVFRILTSVATLGVVLGAVYMLSLYRRIMFGEIDQAKNGNLSDVSRAELAAFAPLFALVIIMGIFPQTILGGIRPSVDRYLNLIEQRKVALDQSPDSSDSGGVNPDAPGGGGLQALQAASIWDYSFHVISQTTNCDTSQLAPCYSISSPQLVSQDLPSVRRAAHEL